jgi:hypothetical protein
VAVRATVRAAIHQRDVGDVWVPMTERRVVIATVLLVLVAMLLVLVAI